MATVDLKEGDVIVNEQELNEAFTQRDTAIKNLAQANAKVQEQKVLINQCNKVVSEINKVFPGLFNGQGIGSFNISVLMDGKTTKALEPECAKLFELLEQYKKTNPIVL